MIYYFDYYINLFIWVLSIKYSLIWNISKYLFITKLYYFILLGFNYILININYILLYHYCDSHIYSRMRKIIAISSIMHYLLSISDETFYTHMSKIYK